MQFAIVLSCVVPSRMTPSEAPKALQAPECTCELLDHFESKLQSSSTNRSQVNLPGLVLGEDPAARSHSGRAAPCTLKLSDGVTDIAVFLERRAACEHFPIMFWGSWMSLMASLLFVGACEEVIQSPLISKQATPSCNFLFEHL